MRLPRSLHNRILYMLLRTKEIRSGKFHADPRWLTCHRAHVAERAAGGDARIF